MPSVIWAGQPDWRDNIADIAVRRVSLLPLRLSLVPRSLDGDSEQSVESGARSVRNVSGSDHIIRVAFARGPTVILVVLFRRKVHKILSKVL